MATLKNHPGFWLRDDVALQFDYFESQHGVITLNDAGRTAAEQQALIDRWDRGGTYNRPPYLFEPARPPYNSNHVAYGGIAFDTASIEHCLKYGREYGFIRPYDWDVVHFEYREGLVTKWAPNNAVPVTTVEDQEMKVLYITDNVDGNGGAGWWLLNPRTGKLIHIRADDKYGQSTANSWARVWGDAPSVSRQDALNAIDGIRKTM